MSLEDFPREPLLFGPSPVHPLRRLSECLGGQVEIWRSARIATRHLGGQPAINGYAAAFEQAGAR